MLAPLAVHFSSTSVGALHETGDGRADREPADHTRAREGRAVPPVAGDVVVGRGRGRRRVAVDADSGVVVELETVVVVGGVLLLLSLLHREHERREYAAPGRDTRAEAANATEP